MTNLKTELKAMKENGSKLERKVINILLNRGSNEEIKSFMNDVLQHGCVSGIVNELIYYSDTIAFYEKYRKDIHSLLKESMEDMGVNSPSEMFSDKWENDDPFAEETSNQNLLAWWAFEETAYRLSVEMASWNHI